MSDLSSRTILGIGLGIGSVVAYVAYRAGQSSPSKSKPADRRDRESKSQYRKDAVLNYVADTTVKLHPVQKKLIERTMQHARSRMLSAPEQLQFLGQLVKSMGAKKTLDIGVFTGYSALAIALQLPENGRLFACDVSEEFVNVGKPFWKEAGVDKTIELKIAPAAESMQYLIDMGEAGTFDFAFIDADKLGYDTYYELALILIRPGGIIALDNMFYGGKVVDDSFCDPSCEAIRSLNRKLASDPRVRYSLLTIGDGTGIAFKL